MSKQFENDKRIIGFISHRCKDYDDAPWRGYFENFLISRGITPKYGCLMDKNCHGILSNNIRKAMIESHVYIAVITESWQKAEIEGWPKKEWEMWKEINKDDEKLERCFGFIIDTPRNEVQFIQDLISYRITKTISGNSISLFGQNSTFFIRDTDFNRMNAQIDRYIREIEGTY